MQFINRIPSYCFNNIIDLLIIKFIYINFIVISLYMFFIYTSCNAQTEPRAISTFHSIGLYWSPIDKSNENECEITYHKSGDRTWKKGLSLWFDERNGEYRGSLVNLESNTEYEIKLQLPETNNSVTIITNTWSEVFPILKTIYVPEKLTETLEINQSGSAYGYVLYTHESGKNSTIDVKNNENYNINITGSYIIIRGLILKNAQKDAIFLNTYVHDIVIENCDISGWGRHRSGEWGISGDAAIKSNTVSGNSEVKRIIIQRNRIHHPRWDTNSWIEPTYPSHPYGPWATNLPQTQGNHVIRYNSIYSDDEHYFEDGFSGWKNFSYKGAPNRDSDIYGNYIERCWDNPIEAEGANMNVRIWGNFINRSTMHIGVASTSLGPLYIFRNVSSISRQSDLNDWNNDPRGGFLKTSSKDAPYIGGRIFVFHNTILQPPSSQGINGPLGCSIGLGAGWNGMINTISRNNIIHVAFESGRSINDFDQHPNGSYDYDLYNGMIVAEPGNEGNGINGLPIYDPIPSFQLSDGITGRGLFTLSTSSPGFDEGIIIPNFNDDFHGTGPDIGASEAGGSPAEFGIEAYLNSMILPPSPENLNIEKSNH
jgi:hypothetical protein